MTFWLHGLTVIVAISYPILHLVTYSDSIDKPGYTTTAGEDSILETTDSTLHPQQGLFKLSQYQKKADGIEHHAARLRETRKCAQGVL